MRNQLLQRFHELIWIPKKTLTAFVAEYNRYSHLTFEQLLDVHESMTFIDEMRLVRDLSDIYHRKSQRAKDFGEGKPNEEWSTPTRIITYIRAHPKTYNSFVREERLSIALQVAATELLIEEIDRPANDHQRRWKLVIHESKPLLNVVGTVDQLKLHLLHARKGCMQARLSLEDQFDEVVGPLHLRVSKWSPKCQTSSIESSNKQFGAPFDGKGRMRDKRIDRQSNYKNCRSNGNSNSS